MIPVSWVNPSTMAFAAGCALYNVRTSPPDADPAQAETLTAVKTLTATATAVLNRCIKAPSRLKSRT
ncbi:hypothetical protein GCM10022380_88020 [Amycolatopsis tucumanensis]|uniref:Uncharacterized protein n=1 Tax=Amycolatopsis tucumanensis TaxID=401106 RepID=A0ABP7JYC2_9PSEU